MIGNDHVLMNTIVEDIACVFAMLPERLYYPLLVVSLHRLEAEDLWRVTNLREDEMSTT